MGLPWPPTYEEGDECGICVDDLFDGKTPLYTYAQVTGVDFCNVQGGWPDLNRVIRLTQDPISPCFWHARVDGVFPLALGYSYILGAVNSQFGIGGIPAGNFFHDLIPAACRHFFNNANVCGPPLFPMGFGGTCHIVW